jgi:transposase
MRKQPTSLRLSKEELAQLEQWAQSQHALRPLILRARIVLACITGRPQREIARELEVTAQTVGKWRARFASFRLAGLCDRPRRGAPRHIDDAVVQLAINKTLHERAPNSKRWTSRALARELGLSPSTVLRIWRILR